jgi:hypothetical protein
VTKDLVEVDKLGAALVVTVGLGILLNQNMFKPMTATIAREMRSAPT